MSESAQRLIDTLKFSPFQAVISITGYGGEAVLGTISPECYDYWIQRDVSDIASGMEDSDIPEHVMFIEPGCWYECDNIAHLSGPELTEICRITVTNKSTGETIWEHNLDIAELEESGVSVEMREEYYTDNQPDGTCTFFGQSIEKGLLFEGEFTLRSAFDPRLLTLGYEDIEDWYLVSCVQYDSEEIECTDADTSGKATHFQVLRKA